jgi:hypothetical protein
MRAREDLSGAFHMSHLALVSIHAWGKELCTKVKIGKAASAVSQCFLMRRECLRWIE